MDNTQQVDDLVDELMVLKVVELKALIRDLKFLVANAIRTATRKADMCRNIAYLMIRSKRQTVIAAVNDYMPSGHHFVLQHDTVWPARRAPNATTTTTSTTITPELSSRAAGGATTSSMITTTTSFKPTPFYSSVQRLAGPLICPIVSNTCLIRTLMFTLTEAQVSLLQSHQIRVFCAACPSDPSDFAPRPLEFPQVSELHINNNKQISAQQLRGIKNSPGTVHAANITQWIDHAGSNQVQLIYAKTQKQYVVTVELVKVHPVEELIQQMTMNQSVTKEDILASFREQQANADIQLEFETLSLKCPLSCSRITLPCRSRNCRHAQCFDGVAYMKMNEQTPTWKCPVCNCPIPFQDLIVDGFFADILANSSESIQSVRINSTGELQHEFTVKEESDDDQEQESTLSTPLLSSSGATEQSLPTTTTTPTTTSTLPTNSNNNRPVVMVDLTLSDQE